ncbi:MAG: hypothetical protein BMS9Abin05_1305 [Rhodothermia bacterium]|nr:MAG: hypothetical protein BMS9Abin05_1305 [Rhodothermia bacterium]
MSDLKTKPTDSSVDDFLSGVHDEEKRADCFAILELMKKVTGDQPRMWGASMVGFGSYHYKYDSGREGDWFITGFAPRKKELSVYIMSGFKRCDDLMQKLGKYRTGKSCLYLKRLRDVDVGILRELVEQSVAHMRSIYE